jgi:hypothetical protein
MTESPETPLSDPVPGEGGGEDAPEEPSAPDEGGGDEGSEGFGGDQ